LKYFEDGLVVVVAAVAVVAPLSTMISHSHTLTLLPFENLKNIIFGKEASKEQLCCAVEKVV